MSRILLNFSEISDDLLAPENIYWRRKEGIEILISTKADILNFEMLEKLSLSKQTLLIEESTDYEIYKEFVAMFKEYESEISIKSKLKWRKKLISILMEHYYFTDKTQFELDQLCWKVFSEFDKHTGKEFLNRDCDYFKRTISVASSYALCALLLGYYDETFLRKIYNSTIVNLMNIGPDKVISSLKENLELIRKKSSLETDDKSFISAVVDDKNFEQKFLFEKFDGSGAMTINIHEMSDLELVLSSLNYYFHFEDTSERKNILAAMKDSSFHIEKRILNLMRRNFELLNEEKKVS